MTDDQAHLDAAFAPLLTDWGAQVRFPRRGEALNGMAKREPKPRAKPNRQERRAAERRARREQP